jgi:hypothetical protein
MNKKLNSICTGTFLFMLVACTSSTGNSNSKNTDSTENNSNGVNGKPVPEDRSNVKTTPVDQFSEKTDNPINNWYFTVKLFETAKTFQYRVSMKFEEIEGEDTLRLPDLGIAPHPVLKKGTDRYSCVIGFLDKENQFREYKLVHVENGNLKITTLKHYSVTQQ